MGIKEFWRQNGGTIVLSIIFSVFYVFGMQFGSTGYLDVGLLGNVARIALCVPAVYALLCFLEWLMSKVNQSGGAGLIAGLAPSFTRKSIFVTALIIFAVWGVYLISFYPGSMGWDTFYQIYQCNPDNHPFYDSITGEEVNHHYLDTNPIFDTLIFGFFALTSERLFGLQSYGVFLYVAIQGFLTTLAFAASCAYLGKWASDENRRAFRSLQGTLVAFFVLFPPIGIYATSMTKDSLFSLVYVPYFILFLEIVRTKGNALGRRRVLAAFIMLTVLCALTKKTGLYLVVISGVLLALVYRKYWLKILAAPIASSLVMLLFLPRVVFPLLDVAPGTSLEFTSILYQQTARYAVEHPGDVTEDEHRAISAILNWDVLSDIYDPLITDPVKHEGVVDFNPSSGETLGYVKAWLSQGVRDPLCYFEALFATSAGYFAPTANIEIYTHTGSSLEYESPTLTNPDFLDPVRLGLANVYSWLCETPLTSWLFSISLYTFVMPMVALWLTWRYKRELLPAFIPVFTSLLICVASPYSWARYALPLVYTMPMLFVLVCSYVSQRKVG